jgi:hypothetical protein
MLNSSVANHGLHEARILIDQKYLVGYRCWKIGSPGSLSIVSCYCRYSWDERKVAEHHAIYGIQPYLHSVKQFTDIPIPIPYDDFNRYFYYF